MAIKAEPWCRAARLDISPGQVSFCEKPPALFFNSCLRRLFSFPLINMRPSTEIIELDIAVDKFLLDYPGILSEFSCPPETLQYSTSS
jgi:hypothetical protein